jgi:hypothetical protein
MTKERESTSSGIEVLKSGTDVTSTVSGERSNSANSNAISFLTNIQQTRIE